MIFNSFLRHSGTGLILALLPLALLANEPSPPAASTSAPAPAGISMDAVEAAWARGDFVFVRQGLKHLAETSASAQVQYRYGRVLLEGRGGPQDLMAARDWLERAAAQNQASAAVLLARLYLSGTPGGPARDPARAVVLLRPVAVRGNGEAQYYLGLLYRAGEGVTADPVEALTWMQAAAENDTINAQFELSRAYSRGWGTKIDGAKALTWLQRAAEGGHGEAQYSMAAALDSGRGVARDRAAALNWLLRAAEGGFLRAQVVLGKKYLGGEAVEANPEEAQRWLALGVEAGDLEATVTLGLALRGGQGLAPNLAQARVLLRQGAAEGAPRASFALGQMAEQQQDGFAQAVKMYRQAVSQGSEPAVLRLGALASAGQLQGQMAPHRMVPWVLALATGEATGEAGVSAASAWLQTQAEAGLRPAQAALGQLLLKEDASAAAPWLLRAAEAGDVEAQHHLGRLHIQGDGVAQDYVQAHKWLNVAAAGGSSAAFEMRAVVADLMTPEQVAAAQTLARQFFAEARPTPQTEAGSN